MTLPPDYYCRFGYPHPVIRLAETCTVHDPERDDE